MHHVEAAFAHNKYNIELDTMQFVKGWAGPSPRP